MATNQNIYFPNFSKLSFSDALSQDFADLVEFVFEGCTIKVEFLELVENSLVNTGHTTGTWTKQEALFIDHMATSPMSYLC